MSTTQGEDQEHDGAARREEPSPARAATGRRDGEAEGAAAAPAAVADAQAVAATREALRAARAAGGPRVEPALAGPLLEGLAGLAAADLAAGDAATAAALVELDDDDLRGDALAAWFRALGEGAPAPWPPARPLGFDAGVAGDADAAVALPATHRALRAIAASSPRACARAVEPALAVIGELAGDGRTAHALWLAQALEGAARAVSPEGAEPHGRHRIALLRWVSVLAWTWGAELAPDPILVAARVARRLARDPAAGPRLLLDAAEVYERLASHILALPSRLRHAPVDLWAEVGGPDGDGERGEDDAAPRAPHWSPDGAACDCVDCDDDHGRARAARRWIAAGLALLERLPAPARDAPLARLRAATLRANLGLDDPRAAGGTDDAGARAAEATTRLAARGAVVEAAALPIGVPGPDALPAALRPSTRGLLLAHLELRRTDHALAARDVDDAAVAAALDRIDAALAAFAEDAADGDLRALGRHRDALARAAATVARVEARAPGRAAALATRAVEVAARVLARDPASASHHVRLLECGTSALRAVEEGHERPEDFALARELLAACARFARHPAARRLAVEGMASGLRARLRRHAERAGDVATALALALEEVDVTAAQDHDAAVAIGGVPAPAAAAALEALADRRGEHAFALCVAARLARQAGAAAHGYQLAAEGLRRMRQARDLDRTSARRRTDLLFALVTAADAAEAIGEPGRRAVHLAEASRICDETRGGRDQEVAAEARVPGDPDDPDDPDDPVVRGLEDDAPDDDPRLLN